MEQVPNEGVGWLIELTLCFECISELWILFHCLDLLCLLLVLLVPSAVAEPVGFSLSFLVAFPRGGIGAVHWGLFHGVGWEGRHLLSFLFQGRRCRSSGLKGLKLYYLFLEVILKDVEGSACSQNCQSGKRNNLLFGCCVRFLGFGSQDGSYQAEK